jgi:hypothetical protein
MRWNWRSTLVGLGCLLGSAVHADTLGIHVYTHHEKPWFQNRNPGLQWKQDSGLTIGGYCNSYSYRQSEPARQMGNLCQLTGYVGWTFETDSNRWVGVGISPVVLFGYKHGIQVDMGPLGEFKALPHLLPNIRIGPAIVYFLDKENYHLMFRFNF